MSLNIFIGPMFAGKTTKLINMYTAQTSFKKIVIDYDITERSTEMMRFIQHGVLENHNGHFLSNVLKCKELNYLRHNDNYAMYSEDVVQYYYSLFRESDHIYINECQFFPDLKDFVLYMLQYNKHIYLYGLDGDFKQQLFGQTLELIPYADYIEKIKGKCNYCDKRSVLSHRLTGGNTVYLPDSKIYVPCCRNCPPQIKP